MRLVLVSSIEELLQQITVRRQSHAGPVRNICRQVEDGVSIVVLGDLHKVLRTGICKQVDPFLGVINRGGEVLDEIIVNHIRTIGL